MAHQLQILHDGPYTLLTLETMGRWANMLMHRGRILGNWHSADPATFEAYPAWRGAGRAVTPILPCPTCTGFADCDGLHD